MSFISIDIGMNRITAVQGLVNGNMIEIETSDTAPLKRGCIVNNLVKSQLEVTAAITSLFEKNRSFRANKAIITINPGSALIREFIVPSGNARQLEAMVRNEMLNYNTASSSDIIEYKILENTVDAGGAQGVRVRAVSLSHNIVDPYHQVLQSAKLRPIAMDIHPNAIEKLLARRPQFNGIDLKEDCFLLLDLGYSGVMAYIVYDYKVYATRFIPIGLIDFEADILISRIDNKGNDDMPLNFDQILDFRDESVIDPKIMRSAEETMVQCCNEIQKLIIYSTSHMTRNSISCAFITGEGSRIPGIDGFLSSELNTTVMPLSYVSGIKFSNQFDEKGVPYLLNAVSALIRL